jgi:pilus assembly protein CpaB
MRAVSIPVNDVQGVAGFVLPGDHVDVYLSHDGGRGAGTAYVDLILQDAKVVAIDQISDSKNELPSVVRTVTFEITPEEAQKVTLAGTIGTLSLSLRNQAEQGSSTGARLTSTDLGLTAPEAEAPAPQPKATPEPAAPATPPSVGVIRNGQRESYPIDEHEKAPQ